MTESLKTQYLKIGEFARAIGVSENTLRIWDKQGVLTPHHKTPYGYRVYTLDQVQEYLSNSGEKNV